MSWDPLLSEDWPTAWVPFTVEVRLEGDRVELRAGGQLDRWTAGALLRNLIGVCEPPCTEVHLDLRHVDGADEAHEVLERCRAYAEGRGVRFHVTTSGVAWRRPEPPPVTIAATG